MTQKRPERKDNLYLHTFSVVFTKGRESTKPRVPPAVEPGIQGIVVRELRRDFRVQS